MRNLTMSLSLAAILTLTTTSVFAQVAAPGASQSSASASSNAATTAKYTTAETLVGTLLDDPAAKAILDKYIPGFTTNEQVDQARGMTLKEVQQYAPDSITDEVLAKIDAEFAKLPK